MKRWTLAAAVSLFLFPRTLSASAAAEPDASAVYLGIVDRGLKLDGRQKAAAKAVFDDARPELERLEKRRGEAQARAQKIRVDLFDRTGGRAASRTPEHGTIFSRASSEQDLVAQETAAVALAEQTLWAGLWQKVSALLDSRQTSGLDAIEGQVAQARRARIIRDHLLLLADIRLAGDRSEGIRLVEQSRESIVQPWIKAWKAKDAARFEALLGKNFESSSWSDFSASRSDELYSEYALRPSAMLDRARAVASIRELWSQYRKIEGVDLTFFGAERHGAGKTLKGLLSVRGINERTSSRMETTAAVILSMGREGAAESIEKIELVNGRQVVSALTKPYFENATAASGLAEVPVYLRDEAIRRGGYALAVNTAPDGRMYIYAGSSKGGMLLKDDGLGRFSDVTKASGLGRDELVKAAVFADFNNDGNTDLLLVRFEYSPKKQIALYEGLGNGQFRPAKNFDFSRFGKYEYNLPMPIAVGDFDGDQKLDFYVGFPGKMDFTTMASGRPATTPGHPQGLFLNKGDFVFSDQTDYSLYQDAGLAKKLDLVSLFPHSAVAADLTGGGRTDIVVVDDRRDPMPIFRNKGHGAFEQVAEKIGVRSSNWGMSSPIADFNNDGSPDMYLTNVNFPASFAAENDTAWLSGKDQDHPRSLGNHLYRNDGKGRFEETTGAAGLRFAGTAPAGASFIDFDNDGRMDLFVANGLWSAGPRARDFSAEFILAGMNQETLSENRYVRNLGQERVLSALWGSQPETNDLLTMLKNYVSEDGAPVYSLGGGERDRLYRNNGDGTFTDVSYLSGADSVSDGYVAAIADVNRDGASDLVLRNCDPGTEAQTFPTVELFLNNVGGLKNHLDLRLAGVKSNRDAIGAKVTVRSKAAGLQYRELIANNGAVQDDKLLHFGLGGDAEASEVEVRWPAGGIQTFRGVKAGRYALKEGQDLKPVGPTFVSQRAARD